MTPVLGTPGIRSTRTSVGSRRSSATLSDRYGFRHVASVRLVVDGDAVRATATGVTHRYPRTVPVPLHVAAQLVAAGVPLEIEQRAGDNQTEVG